MATQSPSEENTRDPKTPGSNRALHTERVATNFIGGGNNPETGNVTPSGPLDVDRGQKPTGSELPRPQTALGSVSPSPVPSPQPIPKPQVALPAPPPAPVAAPSPPPAPAPVSLPAPAPAPAPKKSSSNILTTVLAIGASLAFCHVSGTPVRMANGSWKEIQDIKTGDVIVMGGVVHGRGELLVQASKIYDYLGTQVTGSHPVFEDGYFIRVENSPLAVPAGLPDDEVVSVYVLATENHLMVLEQYISSDYQETDELSGKTPEDRLAELNAKLAPMLRTMDLRTIAA